MFIVSKNRRINEWPVVVAVPQSGGTVQKQKMTVDFEILPQSEIDALMQESRTADQDAALLMRVVKGWGQTKDEDTGEALEYNAETCANLVDISYVRAALIRAYFEAASGNAAARKN